LDDISKSNTHNRIRHPGKVSSGRSVWGVLKKCNGCVCSTVERDACFLRRTAGYPPPLNESAEEVGRNFSGSLEVVREQCGLGFHTWGYNLMRVMFGSEFTEERKTIMKWMNPLIAIVVVTFSSTAHAELRGRLSGQIEAEEGDSRPALLPTVEQDEYFSDDAADKAVLSADHADGADCADCGGDCVPSCFSGLWDGFCGGHCRSWRPGWLSGLHFNCCPSELNCGPSLPRCPAPKFCLPKFDFQSLCGFGCHACESDGCEADCCGKKPFFDGLLGRLPLHGLHCCAPAACDGTDDCGCVDHGDYLPAGPTKVEPPLQPIPQDDAPAPPTEESSVMRRLLPLRLNLLPIGLSL
jgi:hypothetical protein